MQTTLSTKPRVCFVGIGNMGNPMAANLIKAGYPVSVFDLVRGKADNLIAHGATWASSLAEGAAAADVVIASLPGPDQVRAAMSGNLCRCTGYAPIVAAVLQAAAHLRTQELAP